MFINTGIRVVHGKIEPKHDKRVKNGQVHVGHKQDEVFLGHSYKGHLSYRFSLRQIK